MREFKFKKNITFRDGITGKFISNTILNKQKNLDLIKDFLRAKPQRIELFKDYPEGWEELLQIEKKTSDEVIKVPVKPVVKNNRKRNNRRKK